MSLIHACGPERDIDDQLIIAARKNDFKKVEELIQNGANVNAREKVVGEGETALFNAAAAGHANIVKLLINHGGRVDRPPGKVTPLMMAAWAGHTDTVRVLLSAGADVNAKDNNGHAALTDAVRKNHTAVARLLIEQGADVNVRLPDGNTPLSWAQAKKNQEMIDLLTRAGAHD
jgi:ankyrin repeat protein